MSAPLIRARAVLVLALWSAHAVGAPELGQPFGKASKHALSELCFQKHAVVQVQGVDRWGRVIGRVDCAEADVAKAQVQSGMAWVYRKYSQRPGLLAQEAHAQDASVGLWAQPAVAPWIWRQQRRPENER